VGKAICNIASAIRIAESRYTKAPPDDVRHYQAYGLSISLQSPPRRV